MWVVTTKYGEVKASAYMKSNLMVELEQLMKVYGYYTVEDLLKGERWKVEYKTLS